MADAVRFLVANAYPSKGRAALAAVGASDPGVLYARILAQLLPDVRIDHLCPADPAATLPSGAALAQYDGIVWTGSSLTIHASDDPRVQRQVALARAAFAAGVPSFGSCWAAQLAVTAAGGACARNPRGREFGIARAIRLTAAGMAHPLFAGKMQSFDAFTSHADEIVTLPVGAVLLASNDFAQVQAVAVTCERGEFWAVQYHPEYDFHEVARLSVLRADELIAQGTLADAAAAVAYTEALEALHSDPQQPTLVAAMGAASPGLGLPQRMVEVHNWLHAQVLPRHGRSGRR